MHLKHRKHYICYWKMNISVLLFCIYSGHWIWMGSCRKTRCCHSFSHLIHEPNAYTWTEEKTVERSWTLLYQHNSWAESCALGFPALCTKRGVLPLLTLGAELNMSRLWACKMRHSLAVIQQNTSCGGLALANSDVHTHSPTHPQRDGRKNRKSKSKRACWQRQRQVNR